mmetsp:Transcript_7160/g.8587  ORF Transcript_7160/g.8587 Transcript_7160/m.8587 type:complete len:80 (+) Transcript_7160:100-339(+)
MRGWDGLTRINSIEDNFGGGADCSNKATRRQMTKGRPISANPHMRNKKGLAHLPQKATQENMRLQESRRSHGRSLKQVG